MEHLSDVHWKKERKTEREKEKAGEEKGSCVLVGALHLCLPLSKQELLS